MTDPRNLMDEISDEFKRELVVIIGSGHDDEMIKELLSALREKETLELCAADEEVLTLLTNDDVRFERPSLEDTLETFIIDAPKFDVSKEIVAIEQSFRRERQQNRSGWVKPGKKNRGNDYHRFMGKRRR